MAAFAFCRHPAHGGLCASGSDDGSVQLWDADSLSPLAEHDLHQVGVKRPKPALLYLRSHPKGQGLTLTRGRIPRW